MSRRLNAWRWPALIAIPALLAGAVAAERVQGSTSTPGVPTDQIMPVAAGPGALSSTWYCAGGTATGANDGFAEQTVEVTNTSAQALSGRLTAYPSEGAAATRPLDLPAHTRVDVKLSSVVKAPYASALVEVDGGEVVVQHEVSGASGRDVGACASAPATNWYFPSGTTRSGARNVLAVFNPFPGDAVLDVGFETDDGARTPQSYQGLVVGGGRVVALDVTDVVTLRNELSTVVKARSGRVVVDQLQSQDGSEGSAKGLAVTLGAPTVSATWMFPDGIGAVGYGERFALLNPADTPAEVDVQVLLDDPQANGVAEPFQVSVPAGRYTIIDVFADGRVPPGVAHSAIVQSTNGVPVVAERVITGTTEAAQPGLGYTIGSPLVATRWLAAAASFPGLSGGAVIVSNPSRDHDATVSVSGVGDGFSVPIEGMSSVVIPAGGRQIFDVGTTGQGRSALGLDVRSDSPVVAETRFGFKDGNDLAYLIGVPVNGTESSPTDLVGAASPATVVVGGG